MYHAGPDTWIRRVTSAADDLELEPMNPSLVNPLSPRIRLIQDGYRQRYHPSTPGCST